MEKLSETAKEDREKVGLLQEELFQTRTSKIDLLEKIGNFKSQASTAANSSSSHKKCTEKVMDQSRHIIELEKLLVNKTIEISQLNIKLSTVEQELNMVKSCNKVESRVDNEPRRVYSAYYGADTVLKPNIVASTIEIEEIEKECANIMLKIPDQPKVVEEKKLADSDGSSDLHYLRAELDSVKKALEHERMLASEKEAKAQRELAESQVIVGQLQLELSKVQSEFEGSAEQICAGVIATYLPFGSAHSIVDSSRVFQSEPMAIEAEKRELEEKVKEYEEEIRIKNSIIESLEGDLKEIQKSYNFSDSSEDDEQAFKRMTEAKTQKNRVSAAVLNKIRDPIVDISKIQRLSSLKLKRSDEDKTDLESLLSAYIEKQQGDQIDTMRSDTKKSSSPLFEQDKIIWETIRRMQQQQSRINQLEQLLVEQCSELKQAHEEKTLLMAEVMRDVTLI